MNIRLTRDEFHDVIMTYVINLAEEDGKMISEGTQVHSPIFDEFLVFLHNKSLGSLRMAYNRMNGNSKLNYKKLKSKLDNVREMVITL